MNEYVIDGHLGGYVKGGDPATQYEELWDWLVNERGVQSVIDVGCGEGQAIDYFSRLNISHSARCAVLGIEGVPQDHPKIIRHDYTTGPLKWTDHGPLRWADNWAPGWSAELEEPRVDLAWCCEFVEHVEERYVPNFLATFACADLVLMTHAGPGQAGYHHVNCQPADYWIFQLASAGFVLDAGLTQTTRALAAQNRSPWNHYVRSGLAFGRAL